VDSTVNPGATYTWAINGTVVQSGTLCAFAFTWTVEGTYELRLRQVSAGGCESQLKAGQVIVTPALAQVPLIHVFPNPLDGPDLKFQVTLNANSMVTIELFAANGQLISRIFQGELSSGECKTLSYRHNLSQGIYLYQIRTHNQNINGKIIVISVY
jgi:hypothetical protein